LDAHDPADPFFLYLPWQAMHNPYDNVPHWPHNGEKPAGTYRGMMWAADVLVGRMVELLHKKGMWQNTLIVYSADNGGKGDGINYPYRGEKRTNFEGGMRVAAFVSGGLIPANVRGTTSDIRMHIVDWYPTFCRLAGIDASDGSLTAPLPVPVDDPTPTIRSSRGGDGADWTPTTDIYGDASWPDIDGVDVWDMIVSPRDHSKYSAHETIALSHEVLLKGKYKLMVAQRGATRQNFDDFEAGWRYPNYTWVQPSTRTCGEIFGSWENTQGRFKPCLFDLEADPREEHDLSTSMPELRDEMYKTLNDTWRTYFYARSPPELIGSCNAGCANTRWKSMGGISGHGPTCGVPGCEPPPLPPPSDKCTWVEKTGLGGNKVGDVVPAESKEQCCGWCQATDGCVAADWNNRSKDGSDAGQGMCHMRDCDHTACGHSADWGLACVPSGSLLV